MSYTLTISENEASHLAAGLELAVDRYQEMAQTIQSPDNARIAAAFRATAIVLIGLRKQLSETAGY